MKVEKPHKKKTLTVIIYNKNRPWIKPSWTEIPLGKKQSKDKSLSELKIRARPKNRLTKLTRTKSYLETKTF